MAPPPQPVISPEIAVAGVRIRRAGPCRGRGAQAWHAAGGGWGRCGDAGMCGGRQKCRQAADWRQVAAWQDAGGRMHPPCPAQLIPGAAHKVRWCVHHAYRIKLVPCHGPLGVSHSPLASLPGPQCRATGHQARLPRPHAGGAPRPRTARPA